jgi:glycosyltransferase involved in cell wall biosynthesis
MTDRTPSVRKPLHVVHVIDNLRTGGAQSVLYGVVHHSDPAGIKSWVVALGQHHNDAFVRRVREACEGLFFVGVRGMWDLRAVGSVRRLIQRLHADVLHTHLALADFVGGLAGALTGTPVVSTLHNVAAERRTYPLARRILANYATRRLADHLIAVSRAVRETHVQCIGIPAPSIDVVPNVPIAPLLIPNDFDREAKRRELGVSAGHLICNVAALFPSKDQETLLHALQRVVQERPDVKGVIAGDGPQRPRLEALARGLGLQEVVRFLGDRPDAVEVMAASDVACQLTFQLEGLPIAVLDAMSLGLPIVATGVSGVLEVLEDERSGILVAPGDVEGVSRALLRLLQSPEERVRIGAAARRDVLADFDPKTWIGRIEAIYREVPMRKDARRSKDHCD